jgi:hypothetical protein
MKQKPGQQNAVPKKPTERGEKGRQRFGTKPKPIKPSSAKKKLPNRVSQKKSKSQLQPKRGEQMQAETQIEPR